jgi:hypothetical protein
MIVYCISYYKPSLADTTALYPVIILAYRPGMEANKLHTSCLLLVAVHEELGLPAKITGKRKTLAVTEEVH